MPALRLRPRLSAHRFVPVALGASALLGAPAARGDFSRPPESPYQYDAHAERPPRVMVEDPSDPWPSLGTESTLRFHVGPAVLLEPRGPGLLAAIDVGRRAVGARASAAWLRAESERGLSTYDLELWIDFHHRARIHPIVGAGASLLQGAALGGDENVGAAALRGALECELPVDGADARLALNIVLHVPAVGTERTRPWALAALTLGAGF